MDPELQLRPGTLLTFKVPAPGRPRHPLWEGVPVVFIRLQLPEESKMMSLKAVAYHPTEGLLTITLSFPSDDNSGHFHTRWRVVADELQ